MSPPVQSLFHDQWAFLQAGDVEVGTPESRALAKSLILEELVEWLDEDDFCKKVKENLDLIYVACQAINDAIGPDKALACWDALQANNMSKCVDGKLVKRKDGKILKPEGYQKLDLTEIINASK